MQKIIKEAEELALSEIDKYGLPSIANFNISNEKGLELAKKFSVDAGVVQIGTRLMDVKLGEAFSKARLQDHIDMGMETTRRFLSQFELDENTIDKILNCVEAHHGTKEWLCKEAEICANADCYRFLDVKHWLLFLYSLSANENSFDENLNFAQEKVDEKWKILSLDICREELVKDHKLIKGMTDRINEK